jgi:hypothetical protein
MNTRKMVQRGVYLTIKEVTYKDRSKILIYFTANSTADEVSDQSNFARLDEQHPSLN